MKQSELRRRIADLNERVWAGRMELRRAMVDRLESVTVVIDRELADAIEEDWATPPGPDSPIYRARLQAPIHYPVPVPGSPEPGRFRIGTIQGLDVYASADLAPGEIRFRSEVSL